MIITEKFTFVHLPKTGGTWLASVMPDPVVYPHLSEHSADKPLYGVFREPKSWYRSWVSFHYSGSEYYKSVSSPLTASVTPLSVESFLRWMIEPTAAEKGIMLRKVNERILGGYNAGMMPIYKRWLESETNADLYSFMADLFLNQCDQVLQFDNLVAGVCNIMAAHGYDTAGAISSPPVNVTNKSVIVPAHINAMIDAKCASLVERYVQ